MTHRKKKNPITLDSTRLFKQAVIGCTVLPSRDDPELNNGVALTTLNAYDENYVKFEDIDGMGEPSYRYWKDVYLIVGYNDKNYKSLKIGDKIFALFQNVDNTFTTVYYNAQIKQLPINNKITIDFLDDSGQYKNIKMILYTNTQTKDGIIKVPTIIHQICAQNTKVHKKAIEKYQKTKKNKHNKIHKSSNKISQKYHKNTSEKYENKKHKYTSSNHKSTHKKQIQKHEIPKQKIKYEIPKREIPKREIPKINQNVENKNKNKRKRKYDQINTNTNINNITPVQPPLKRQRSRPKKQKLKIPQNKIKNININSKSIPIKIETLPSKPPKLNKKISLKIKKRNVKNNKNIVQHSEIIHVPNAVKRQPKNEIFIAPPPPPPVVPIVMSTVPIAIDNRRDRKIIYPPVNEMRVRKKFKKMWGNYEVEMPILDISNDFEFKLDLMGCDVDGNVDDGEGFISGLGMKQKWIKPQEIGEITVGPYVVDIDMFNVV